MLHTKIHIGDIHRRRNKPLGVPELIAIALGGMIGGGIFSVLGVSVSLIGVFTPLAIIAGGIIASFAAYSYVKLGVYYKDEGATYSFFKRTFPNSHFAASLIGWWVVFGYISTLALYSYTFASYAISGFECDDIELSRKLVAGLVLLAFTLINIWSVKGMGKIEDIMVYAKLSILAIISFVLINNSSKSIPDLLLTDQSTDFASILIVASITFVAYEGFQLVIHAVHEMEEPEKNIPRSIYSAIIIAILIYFVISLGAILTIPFEDIIKNKEYALAAGAGHILGKLGTELVILGALLATSSAISGTLFGASRLMAVIAKDGYLPKSLARRSNKDIPVTAIICMATLAFILILTGRLVLILEFGSLTFLLVSVLMAIANYKIHDLNSSSPGLCILACLGLISATVLIFYYEISRELQQIFFIGGIYIILTIGSWLYSRGKLTSSRHSTSH